MTRREKDTAMLEVEIRGAVGGVERRGGLVGCEKDKVVEVVVVCAAVDIRMVISPSSSTLPSVRLSGVPGLLPPLLPPAGSSPSDCCPPPSCSVFIALEEEREERREGEEGRERERGEGEGGGRGKRRRGRRKGRRGKREEGRGRKGGRRRISSILPA